LVAWRPLAAAGAGRYMTRWRLSTCCRWVGCFLGSCFCPQEVTQAGQLLMQIGVIIQIRMTACHASCSLIYFTCACVLGIRWCTSVSDWHLVRSLGWWIP
jgi:hypothetical protein